MKRIAFLFVLLMLIVPQQTFAEQGSVPGPRQDKYKQGYVGPSKAVKEFSATTLEGRKALKEANQARREANKAIFMEKKEEFKQKLLEIKDARKKALAEQLDINLDTINKNRTASMNTKLVKLSEILTKLETKKAEAETAGKDVSSVDASITAAKEAITTAQDAVAAQTEKDYTAQITNESTLQQNFRTVLTQLKTDLKATQSTVADAKQAVKVVAKALALAHMSVETISPTP